MHTRVFGRGSSSSHEASTMYLDDGGANLSKRAETALNMCAPGVCRETQVESISKKIILLAYHYY